MSLILHPPLSHVIAEELKHAIWNKEIQFGERLIETELAERFQVSRSSIREALKILENEELVVSQARRGTYVAEFSLKDRQEIIELRVILEVHAFKQALPHLQEEHFQHLRDIIAQMREKAKENKWSDLFDLDTQFHQYIVHFSNNSRLKKMYDSLQVQIRTALSQLDKYYSTAESFTKEHEDLLAALMSRDKQKVEQSVRQHIEYVEEQLLT